RHFAAAEGTQPERRRVMDGQEAHTTQLDVPPGPFHMPLAPLTVTTGCLDPRQLGQAVTNQAGLAHLLCPVQRLSRVRVGDRPSLRAMWPLPGARPRTGR